MNGDYPQHLEEDTTASQLPCAQYPEGWYSEDTDSGGSTYPLGVRTPKDLCKQVCPVRELCLEMAQQLERGLKIGDRFGIWGGMTPTERWHASEDRRPGSRPWMVGNTHSRPLTLSGDAA